MPVEDARVLTYEEAKILSVQAGTVLQPRSPIAIRELFAGRWTQLTNVADAVGPISLLRSLIYIDTPRLMRYIAPRFCSIADNIALLPGTRSAHGLRPRLVLAETTLHSAD
jgi:hypothetical protein